MGKKRVVVFTSSIKEPTPEKEFKELLAKVLELQYKKIMNERKNQ